MFFKNPKYANALEGDLCTEKKKKIVEKKEAGHSSNLPAMQCLHNSARILTALINIHVTLHHKSKAVKSASKVVY